MCGFKQKGACQKPAYGKMSLPEVKSIQDQITDLVNDGVAVNDVAWTEEYLKDVSFCRLHGYLSGLNDGNGRLRGDATFEMLMNLYEFDSDFRKLLFGEIEIIEVSFRARIVNCFSGIHPSTSDYLDYRNFNRGKGNSDAGLTPEEQSAIDLVEEMVEEIRKKIDSSVQHKTDYDYRDVDIPFCEVAEHLPFSTMTKFFKCMDKDDRVKFRDAYYCDIGCLILDTWLRSISYVRNMCAHHDRLYNIKIATRFKPWVKIDGEPFQKNDARGNRIFVVLLCMKRLLDDVEWGRFVSALKELISGHDEVNVSFMGFPYDWEYELLNVIVN